MKKVLILSLVLFFSNILIAQQINVEDIIASALNENKLLSNNKTAEFINGLDYNLPWIRKVDIRFGINGNATADTLDGYLRNEDYYALVISPNSFRERRLQKNIKPTQINVINSQKGLLLQAAIAERYQSVAAIYHAKQIIEEKIKLKELLDKKSKILELTLGQGIDIKFKDIVDVEYDKNSLQNSILEYENSLINNYEKIKTYLNINDSINLNLGKFITTDEIEAAINKLSLNVNLEAMPQILFRDAQTKYSSAKYELIDAQDRQIFSFFQVGYSPIAVSEIPKSKFNPSNDLAFRIGLTIPIAANNNLKRSEALIDLFEDQNDAQLSRELLSRNIHLQKERLFQLLKAYHQCKKIIEGSLIPKLLANEQLMAQITPLELLDLQINKQKLDLQKLEITENICIEYLKLLEMMGITLDTSKNYLKDQ